MESYIKDYKESRERLVKRMLFHDEAGNDLLFTQVKAQINELDINFYSIKQHAKLLLRF